MKRTSTTSPSQGGFAMVTVIVVLGALAVFGASLVVIATTQQAGAALDFQGVRAYHAARGGLEWGLYQVLRNGQPCAAVTGQTVVYGGNLAGFSATLGCVSSVHEEGSSPVTLFTVTATGCNQPVCAAPPVPPPLDYVNRQLQATVGSN